MQQKNFLGRLVYDVLFRSFLLQRMDICSQNLVFGSSFIAMQNVVSDGFSVLVLLLIYLLVIALTLLDCELCSTCVILIPSILGTQQLCRASGRV